MASIQQATHNSIKIRIIKRTTYGLGFYLRNDGNAVVISGLVPACEAEKSGLVHPGDQISAVNSINVETMTFPQVLAILEKIPVENPVVLLLKGPPNCHTRLVTFFGTDGSPHTTRITESVPARENGNYGPPSSLPPEVSCNNHQNAVSTG